MDINAIKYGIYLTCIFVIFKKKIIPIFLKKGK